MNKHSRGFEPAAPRGPMSDDEFMAFVEGRPDDERWQLIDGMPFFMNPATNRHQLICLRLANLLNDGLEKKRPDLIALTERGLLIPSVTRFRPTADVSVVVNDDGGSYTNVFYLAAEVLSPSNTEEHIALKRKRYMAHPDNLCVIVIAQDEVQVEVCLRASNWEPKMLRSLRNVVSVPELGVRFPLAGLYRGTPLAK